MKANHMNPGLQGSRSRETLVSFAHPTHQTLTSSATASDLAIRLLFSLLCLAAVLANAGIAQADPKPDDGLCQLARLVVSENPNVAESAIAQLRSAGQAGLNAMVFVYPHRQHRSPEMQAKVTAALNAIGAQRNCQTARLYWYTDLDAAKTESRATGKPILSLRLLGKLTDEYSCANSRFFRTALYANEEVSRVLRERYVLHWKSVRPVPKVTIDFGDGRKLERTLTGNSIHYVLDSEGRPIDALPGMYGPAAFLRELARAEPIAKASSQATPETRENLLRYYHETREVEIVAQWESDLRRAGVAVPMATAYAQAQVPQAQAANQPPPAGKAALVAMTKGHVEKPILRLLATDSPASPARLTDLTSDEVWEKIAQLHATDAALDASSIELMRVQLAPAINAGKVARTKREVEDPLLRVVASFQRSIAVDTVRNEYLLHRQIHNWLARSDKSLIVDALNERVYAELFLTPSSDPWLGLVPDATYTALQNDGRAEGK
jgi:hypothetical protein